MTDVGEGSVQGRVQEKRTASQQASSVSSEVHMSAKRHREEVGTVERDVRRRMEGDDELKIVISFKQGHEIGTLGLMVVIGGIKKALGEVEMAKVLRDGRLLVQCKDKGQRDKAMKVQVICKREVSEVRKFRGTQTGVTGVIVGIPLGEKMEDLKRNIRGGHVTEVRRLQAMRNGERQDSLSVLLRFEEAVLPDRVRIGYMSFPVRPYVPPPLRCFKCQRYGHIARVCRGKQRCGKCGGEHEYGECGEGMERKCCNCGGDHTSAFWGCPVRKEAMLVQKVRTERKVTYAEAVKMVRSEGNNEGSEVRQERDEGLGERGGVVRIEADKLILFIAYVINCADQAKTKTEKIKIIVKAAAKFFNMNLSWERIQMDLSQGEIGEMPGQATPSQSCR